MIFSDNILAGVVLTREAIQSENFVTGVSGWRIEKDGDAEFNNAVFRGEIWVGVAPNPQIHIHTVAGHGDIDFWTNHASEVWPGGINAEILVGPPDALTTVIFCPTTLAGGQAFIRAGYVLPPSDFTFIDGEADVIQFDTTTGMNLVSGAGQGALRIREDTDANYRFEVAAYGDIRWADGTNAYDCRLYRTGAAALRTDSSVTMDGSATITGRATVSGLRPHLHVGTTANTASSGTYTAVETITDSITVAVVSGRTYEIMHTGGWRSTVAADVQDTWIREDNVAGTVRQRNRLAMPTASGTIQGIMRTFWTAGASGNKTFVVTGQRYSGTGTCSRYGSASIPSHLTVVEVG
jgi:hypothetical protein